MSREYLDIRPSNLTPNGIVSYKSGQPIIKFDIAEQDAFLYGNSVRICGKLKITTNGATVPSGTDTLSIDGRTGIFGMIDTVTLSSTKTKQTMESIRHYNRFMSSYLPATASNQDLLGHLSQSALTVPSLDTSRLGVVFEAKTNGNEFCVYLPTGLLQNGKPIPLSADTIGGITMEIHLAPPSMFLFDADGNSVGNGYSNADYTLEDLKLVCEVERMTPENKMSSKVNGFEYQSISSYYSTINSTNAILNYSLGLSRVRSVIINFIKSSYLNNLNQNSLQTIMPITAGGDQASANQVVFTRGGVRFPDNFNQDTNYKQDVSVEPVDPELTRNFLNSIVPFSKGTRSQISPVNTNRNWTGNDNGVLEGGLVWGLGVAYDTLGSDGADFSRTNWGLQFNLGLNDDSPNSAFVFVHAKNTLLFSGAGIQVVS